MKSGIYKIENLKNGKVYIGSTKDLNERRINHFSMLRNNTHPSIILQRAWNKSLDKTNFVFSVIERCHENKLIERENFYLNLLCKAQDHIQGLNKDFLKLSYNILPVASKGFSGKHRPETIQRCIMNNPFRKDIYIYKNETFVKKVISAKEAKEFTNCSRTSILKACKDRTFITKSGFIFCFLEDRQEVEKNLGGYKIEIHNKGKKYTEEEIMTIWTLCTPIKVTNLKTQEEFKFFSQKQASRFFKITPSTINRSLKNNSIYKKFLKFEYHKDIV